MAFIEKNATRAQVGNQMRALREEALVRIQQARNAMDQMRVLQKQYMEGNPDFTKEDAEEVDSVVNEIQATIGDVAAKPAPEKLPSDPVADPVAGVVSP